MGRILAGALLVLPAFCLHLVTSTCNPNVLKALQVLRGDVDDSGVLDALAKDRSYQLAYVTIGALSPLLNPEECLVVTFTSTQTKGLYQVEYSGVGTYGLTYNKNYNGFDVIGKAGEVLKKYYVVFLNGGVLALYICDPAVTNDNMYIGAVFAANSTLKSSQPLVDQAINTLAGIGIKNGLRVVSCQ